MALVSVDIPPGTATSGDGAVSAPRIRTPTCAGSTLASPSAQQPNPSDVAAPAKTGWHHAYDLDGDGRNDSINVEFTGGGHCCYRLSVELTSTRGVVALPFWFDGGYVGGLDLSNPSRFHIADDGPVPEIVLEIATDNGHHLPIPNDWKERYGITEHHIAISFPCGELRVRNVPAL
ncbi:MAG: hypothetical protein HOW73_40445 [Polyangiaceae bacterium]|nr:hypothetical protein [Polyangiaceae bacterium]